MFVKCLCKILVWSFFIKIKSCLANVNFVTKKTAYIKNRFIEKNGRLISAKTEISDWLNTEGLLVTMDIRKVFDSLDHGFLSSVLRRFGFGKNVITWIEILLNDQLSYV